MFSGRLNNQTHYILRPQPWLALITLNQWDLLKTGGQPIGSIDLVYSTYITLKWTFSNYNHKRVDHIMYVIYIFIYQSLLVILILFMWSAFFVRLFNYIYLYTTPFFFLIFFYLVISCTYPSYFTWLVLQWMYPSIHQLIRLASSHVQEIFYK